MTPASPAFLDVEDLLHASEVRRPAPRLWYFLGGMVLIMSITAAGASDANKFLVEALTGVVIGAAMVFLVSLSARLVRRLRAEQQAVETIGELVQLRRWTEAAASLQQHLSVPSKTQMTRSQALTYLGSVLSRYQRFEDAIAVYDYLLTHVDLDIGSAYGVRLGRAMAMLRADHLVDADRAISELRRMTPSELEGGGLGLLELYRDVVTGHADDAIARFERLLPAMRDQLGHRVADAWALAARSYDLQNRPKQAAEAFRRATLLAPPGELYRRYPEVRKMQPRYEPAYAPPEAA